MKLNLQGEDDDQVFNIVMAEREPEPGPKQFEEGLTDCLVEHNVEIILQIANVEGFSENKKQFLNGLLTSETIKMRYLQI